MCGECRDLADEAEQIVMLAEAERLLVLAEADKGVNIPNGRRPLFGHEARAGVRFGDMNEALAEAERQMTSIIADATEELADAVLALIPEGTPSSSAGAIVSRMVENPPETVRNILDGVTAHLGDVLAGLRKYGRDAVTSEANRQGIDFTHADGKSYFERARDKATAAAATITASIWFTVMSRVTKAVTSAATVVAGAARTAIVGSNPAKTIRGLVDEARQVSHGQHNSGRADGARAVPSEQPMRIYAGELLDGETCPPCHEIDGYLFPTEEEAMAWYPGGGPMAHCEGGNRCRGTLIYDWSELVEEFDGGVDKSHPPALPKV